MEPLGKRFVLLDGTARDGGMARVVKAVDLKEGGRPVAVKFITSPRVADRILRMAFNRELKALQAVEHPNIVKVIEFDPSSDPPYIVLEWLERDLNAQLAISSFSDWDDYYTRLGAPILEALSFALGKEIVHRDIKAGNILFDGVGTPKLVDFGISAFRTDGIVGPTLAGYKSEPYAPFDERPEREARDPYSFAVLTLRCFAKTELASHEEVAAALDAFPGPPAVRAVLQRALHIEPKERFRSIVDLHLAIEEVQTAHADKSERQVIHVVFLLPALQAVARRLGLSDEASAQHMLLRDLAEGASVFPWRDLETGQKTEGLFLLRTARSDLIRHI